MNKSLILPTLIATVIGLAGALLLMFAWHLPPFSPALPTTENAYVRGKVTSVAPQLAGYLSEVDVVDFQEVKAGDVIARIDDLIYRQKLAQAEATLASAKAAFQVAEQNVRSAEAIARADEAALRAKRSALVTARSDRTRAQALQSRGVSSETASEQAELALQQRLSEVEQAKAQLDVQHESIKSARAQVSAAQANIASAEAAVALAKIDLAHTVIHAPADGRLGQVSARVGQYVTAGTALVSHVGHDVWIIANFKETSLHGMRLGQTARFTVDALGGQAFTGKVASFSPATASEFSLLAGSNATGNFTKIAQRLPVRILIDSGQEMSEYLAPGLSVVVEVDNRTD
ncbi:MAG: hemolysin secretion protein D [Confluentimicrobium sp.]|jgi:multidrug resistance efflux pump|uniref:HlyD family secretion protein n=1 Tax=Actibacterium sp. TaxID=1872125 RepID=UPI000C4E589E|nr:HlyD family secretion protein [Actibacterium sp.]MBC58052.1 hemolysin secretion protein D [Actibacterium sp.]